MRKLRNRKVSLLIAVVLTLSLLTAVAVAGESTTRLEGSDRFHTAGAVATYAYPDGVDTVIIANGEDRFGYADALAASSFTATRDMPILLTRRNTLPEGTVAALQALDPAQVIILGGSAVVSADVEAELAALVDDVVRLSGRTRHETAALLATFVMVEADTDARHAYVVSGFAPADSLVIGPLAATEQAPIFMVSQNSVPDVTATYIKLLGIESLTVIGGDGVVSDAVKAELETMVNGTVERISGRNRYETATKLAELYMAKYPNTDQLIFANGLSLVDAISGSYLGGVIGAPIVYTTSTQLSTETADFLAQANVAGFTPYVLGGGGVIGSNVQQLIEQYMSVPPSPGPSPQP